MQLTVSKVVAMMHTVFHQLMSKKRVILKDNFLLNKFIKNISVYKTNILDYYHRQTRNVTITMFTS